MRNNFRISNFKTLNIGQAVIYSQLDIDLMVTRLHAIVNRLIGIKYITGI